MKHLIIKYLDSLITKKSLKIYDGKYSSVLHQTVIISNDSIAFSFELDKRTKDLWVTVNFKVKNRSPSVLDDNNVINIDFILVQFDSDFKREYNNQTLDERVKIYSNLITKYFDKLVYPTKSNLKKALKLSEDNYQARLKSLNSI